MSKHAQPSSASRGRYRAWLLVVAAVVVSAVMILWMARDFSPSEDLGAADQLESQSSIGERPQSQPQSADADSSLTAAAGECVVTLEDSDSTPTQLVLSEGTLYQGLPILEHEGQVFAGWYGSADAASQLQQTERINGSREVACADGNISLYPAWVPQIKIEEEDAHIPILMYHQFTDKPEGEDNWLRDNFAYIGDFEAHLSYIKEQQFYLPTWDELDAFLDGKLYLPSRSVMVTDDDADATWANMAAPLAEKYQIPITSFVIGIDGPGPDMSQYVWKRSHTYDMHTAGDDGQGRMVNWSVPEIVADLEKSAEVVGGAKQVVAYPYGHNNDAAHQGLLEAGFTMGRTVDPGYVTRDTSKLELPVIRINYGMGVPELAAAID